MAMSLKDHSDTRVNAATFIHTSNTHLQGPRGNHSTQLPHRALWQAKLVFHGGSPTKQLVCSG
jgi:hypothetical protein